MEIVKDLKNKRWIDKLMNSHILPIISLGGIVALSYPQHTLPQAIAISVFWGILFGLILRRIGMLEDYINKLEEKDGKNIESDKSP